jgi:hypothetical protein
MDLIEQFLLLEPTQGTTFADTYVYDTDQGSVPWVPDTVFAANAVITNAPLDSPSWNGLFYRVTSVGGESGPTPPAWSLVIGATITDGANTLLVQDTSSYPVDFTSATGTFLVRETPESTTLLATGTVTFSAPATSGTLVLGLTVEQLDAILAAGLERVAFDVWITWPGPVERRLFYGVLKLRLTPRQG